MNNFIKTFLACLLAIVVSSVLNFIFFLVFIAVIIGSSFNSNDSFRLSANSILNIDLATNIPDIENANLFDEIDLSSLKITKAMPLHKVVSLIKKAESDPMINGILLNMPITTPNSLSTLYEIRQALSEFRERSGKFVISYADVYSQGCYYLASCADKVYLNPQGGLEWSGMSSSIMFFKGLFDKLGVEPEVIRHGKFKGAIEPFLLDKMSPENRSQMQDLVESLWGNTVSQVAKSRSIDSAQLQTYASTMAVRHPSDALTYSFVDALMYRDELSDELSKLTLTEEPQYVTLDQYGSADPMAGLGNVLSDNKIAILYADGDIVDGGDDSKMIVGNKLASELRKLRKDDRVKAVVLRINSPGGSVLASDIIWREAYMMQQEKPLIVSMGAYAASGGYYISCPADAIVTTPTTITGSIGVFGLLFNAEKAARDKLGITVDVVKTNPMADAGSPFRPLTTIEREIMQQGVDSVYERFVGLVAQGRKLSYDTVDAIAQGRVWSGLQAVELSLADRIGTLSDAVALAAEYADVADFAIAKYPERDESFAALFRMLSQSSVSYIKSAIGITKQIDQATKIAEKYQGVKARIPYDIELK